jgi:transglutaminase-like putative cysteine protease
VRFHAVHKLVSYLLAASAVATLLSSGALPLPTLALLLVVGVLSWFVEPGTRWGVLLDRAGLVFNVVALAFFALSLYQVVRSFPEPDLTPILNLVLFLLAYKLLHRRGNRDYFHLYVSSFLLVVAGAWLGQSVLFLFAFAAYVVLATWTLILFHLRREIEDNYLVKHSPEAGTEKVTAARVLNSRRVVGRGFFLATGAVALAVFVGAGFVFASVPRIGAGFLMGGVRRRVSVVGFSDKVTLGHHGVLSTDNQTVVLRAEVPRVNALASDEARDRAIAGLYWHGTVYDLYQDGEWLRSEGAQTITQLDEGYDHFKDGSELRIQWGPELPEGLRKNAALRRRVALADADEHTIWVVGLSHPIAFALDQPVAFRTLPRPMGSFVRTEVTPRYGGEAALRQVLVTGHGEKPIADFKGAHYVAYSRDPVRRPRPLAGTPLDKLPHEQMEPYLRVPTSLSPRVGELARGLTRDKPTAAAKVQAVVEWLQKTHGYTTELKRDPRVPDPLEDFLFHQSAGHCEYFASSAAILLRLAGVPTRYVNGFLGGEWNGISRMITIRDNRAHSWTEAYLGTFGWVRVDATPVAQMPSRMSRLVQLFDSVELFWSRWVMDYDISRQVEIARGIGRRIGLERGAHAERWRLPPAWTLGVAGGIALLGLVAWRLRRRGLTWGGRGPGRSPAGGSPIEKLWQATVDRLGQRGWRRRPDETPREFAARLAAGRVPAAEVVARLATQYGAARYGGHEVPPEAVAEIAAGLEPLAAGPLPPPEAAARPPAAAPGGARPGARDADAAPPPP